MHDANENMVNPNLTKGVGQLLAETDLIDLHNYKLPNTPHPPTYNCRSLTIDHCIGSPESIVALTHTSELPFRLPVNLLGDHQALIVDFDSCILIGNEPPLLHPPQTVLSTPQCGSFCMQWS